MRAHYIIILLITLLTFLGFKFINGAETNFPISSNYDHQHRRILHQPLFPVDSAPAIPPPPPTPDLSDDQVQPFSNELPTGPTFNQAQQPPPLPPTVASPVPTHTSTNPTTKLAIATLSTVVTLGTLLAMAFYLYKNRGKNQDESQKLVRENAQRINEESRTPPSTLLCIEPAEPSTRGLVDETNGASGSPNQKLNTRKKSNHYRPSPDLQPLPPLTKPPPPRINSPPPMSSSDDEANDAKIYAQQGTSPHSKRTPPKSRFSASSPDTRPMMMIPPIKQSLPPASPPSPPTENLQPSKSLIYSPKRTKYSASPPSPHIGQHQSINKYEQKISKIPIPPPPPPHPPLSIQKEYGAAKRLPPFPVSKPLKSQSKSPSPKASPSSEKTRPSFQPYPERNAAPEPSAGASLIFIQSRIMRKLLQILPQFPQLQVRIYTCFTTTASWRITLKPDS